MSTFSILGFSASILTAAPAAPTAGAPAWVRDYVAEYAAHVERAGAPIPAWGRKYQLDCSACHWPAVPRLNGMGIQFRWAGYRMPDEIGQKVDVTDVGHYVSIRGRMRYDYDKTDTGSGTATDPNTDRDFVVTNQFLFNDQGSSLTAVGYYGTVVGLAPSAPGAKSRFWRVGGSANWIIRNLELMGGVAYGKDTDLPTTGAGSFAAAEQTGLGYWAQGQYSFTVENTLWSLFGRYEFVDPDTDVAGNGSKRIVVGSVLPVSLPEYLRLAVEYAHDLKQAAGAPKRNGVTGEVMLNF